MLRVKKAINIAETIALGICKIANQDPKPHIIRFKEMRKLIKVIEDKD